MSTATFSEVVHGLVAGGAALYANAATVVPSTVSCRSGGAAVGCAGSFTTLQVRPASPLVPGQHYSVRLAGGAVQDAAGNPLVARSVFFRGSRSEQEGSRAAQTAWAKVRAAAAYGHSLVREHARGASAMFRFTGTRITWWTVTGRDQGKAAVSVDGKRRAVVNNYAAATHYRVGRRFGRLGGGHHVLRIIVLGRKGATSATGTLVSVDAFSVGTKRAASPALVMGWHRASSTHFSAGHAVTADLRGEAIAFRFRGTSIAWFTQRARNQGKVAVYVDGVRKAVVDDYGLRTAYGVERVVTRLANRLHTLRLVVLGTHHRDGAGTRLTVDRFLVG